MIVVTCKNALKIEALIVFIENLKEISKFSSVCASVRNVKNSYAICKYSGRGGGKNRPGYFIIRHGRRRETRRILLACFLTSERDIECIIFDVSCVSSSCGNKRALKMIQICVYQQ